MSGWRETPKSSICYAKPHATWSAPMPKPLSGLIILCLLLLTAGCATSPPAPIVLSQCPTIPPHLTSELPPPPVMATHNRGLLDLLADYEALRRRANADRAAVSEILEHDPEPAL